MLLIFRNPLDLENSALCVGQGLHKSDKKMQLCEIHKLSRPSKLYENVR